MSSVRAIRSDSVETVDELLGVAERLFADRGVDNVAMTAIVAATSQKNRSALHYHFGSREGLLHAVLDRRLIFVNTLRHRLLDEVERRQPAAVADIVRAAMMPLGLIVIEQPWGRDYVNIIGQVVGHHGRVVEQVIDQDNMSSARRSYRMVAAALPRIGPDVLFRRFRWLNDSVILAIARWARPAAQTRGALDELVRELATYGAAALAAADDRVARVPTARKKTTARRQAGQGDDHGD